MEPVSLPEITTSLSETTTEVALPEVSVVEQLLQQGKSVKEISAELHLKMPQVKQFIRDNQLVDQLQNKSYWGWDEQEDTQLRTELEQGLTLDQMAEIHHRSVGAIRCRFRNLQIELPETLVPKRPSNRWTPQQVEEMFRMKEAGQSLAQISEAIGRTEKAIAAKLKKVQKGQGAQAFTCPCGKDRIRTVFQCGHGSCSACSRKSRLCPTCQQEIHLRIELAF